MNLLQRSIRPVIKVLDSAKGLVEYVASDETVDCYNEVVCARGWRFDNFKKNAPFLNSHRSSSIEDVLGSVRDFKVEGDKLVEVVEWAKDSHPLAKIGFDMTQAGHLKAVSVGFFPEDMVSRRDGSRSKEYGNECRVRGIDPAKGPAVFYLRQQQHELSACAIGANPNAVARAYKAGVITDSDLELISLEQAKSVTADSTDGLAAVESARLQAQERFLVEMHLTINKL